MIAKEFHSFRISEISELDLARRGHSSTILDQTSILIFGGEGEDEQVIKNIEIFDYYLNEKTNKIETTFALSFHQTKIVNGDIFIMGGFDSLESSRNMLYLNLTTKKMKILKKFRKRIDAFSMNLLENRYFIIFGGWDGINVRYNDLYKYYLLENKFVKIIPKSYCLPSIRNGHSGIIWNQLELIIFGGNSGKERLNDVYKFNFRLKTWKKIETFGERPSRRSGHSASLVDNYKMIIVGGFTSKVVKDMDSIYILNLHTYFWERVTNNYIPMLLNPSVNKVGVNNNKLLVFGGLDWYKDKYSSTIYEIDIYTNKYSNLWKKLNENKKYCDVKIIFYK